MEQIKVKSLKNYFTMSMKTIKEIYESLKAPDDVLKAILHLTEDPENLAKADPATKLLYFTDMAYKQGYIRALYDINEVNKATIKDIAAK